MTEPEGFIYAQCKCVLGVYTGRDPDSFGMCTDTVDMYLYTDHLYTVDVDITDSVRVCLFYTSMIIYKK